ncbi:mechanosensitive ion channel family protein [Flexithrix dorotheae]|uniref:mechanosensitive ion channel family protein n=1 Tax=Flexithrix dorotheae TaxID=70993 RepID=UPI00038054B9|nr:mechanosensitive ion channel domain-containing protein [Flexithrix dorotheae]
MIKSFPFFHLYSNRKYLWWVLFFLSIFFLFNLRNSYAQVIPEITNLENPDDSDHPDSVKITPIPLTDIPSSAEQVISDIRIIQKSLLENTDILTIFEEAPQKFEELNEKKEVLLSEDLNEKSISALGDLTNQWERSIEFLNNWQQQVGENLKTREKQQKRLEIMAKTWRKSFDQAIEKEAPDDLLESIEVLECQILDIKDTVNLQLQKLLSLQTQFTNEMVSLTEVKTGIRNLIISKRKQFLVKDQDPIWVDFFDEEKNERIGERLNRAVASNYAAIKDYIELAPSSFSVLFLFFAICSIFFFFIRKKKKTWDLKEDDISLFAALKTIEHPFSSALLLSIFIWYFIYNDAPTIITEVVVVINLIPFFRLRSIIVSARKQRPFLFLLFIILLDRLQNLLIEQTYIDRLLILVKSGLMLFALIYLLKPTRMKFFFPVMAWRKFARLVGVLCVIIFIAAVLSNTVGYVSLSSFLSEGAIYSLSSAVYLFMIARVIIGSIIILINNRPLINLQFIRKNPELVQSKVIGSIRFLAILTWVIDVMFNFNLFNNLYERTVEIIDAPVVIGSISFTMGGIFASIIILWIANVLSKLVKFILEEDILLRLNTTRKTSGSISLFTKYFILGVGFFMALAATGIDMSNFTIILGAFSVGIGFGLQNIFNNLVSGIILAFERPINLGDTVEVGNLKGEVKEIGLRASTVRTFDGAEVIVPNGNLISNEVINWTLSDGNRRIEILLGVAYGTDPNRVLPILIKAAQMHPDVLVFPAPMAVFLGFGDSSLDFRLLFWVSKYQDWMTIRSDIAISIYNALDEADIEIPFPQRDLHIRSTVESEKEPHERGIPNGKGKQPKQKNVKEMAKKENSADFGISDTGENDD